MKAYTCMMYIWKISTLQYYSNSKIWNFPAQPLKHTNKQIFFENISENIWDPINFHFIRLFSLSTPRVGRSPLYRHPKTECKCLLDFCFCAWKKSDTENVSEEVVASVGYRNCIIPHSKHLHLTNPYRVPWNEWKK